MLLTPILESRMPETALSEVLRDLMHRASQRALWTAPATPHPCLKYRLGT
jgi:hypothetical protein